MLAVLAVIALSLLLGVAVVLCNKGGDGRRGGSGSTGNSFFCLPASEKLRPAFLIDHPPERGAGGTGISWNGLCAETIEFA